MDRQPIILGVDPGTRFMGMAVIQGTKLLAFGVHTLRNGERPHNLIGQARRIVLSYIERYAPTIVAIEEPLRLATETAAVLSVINQELVERGKEVNLRVVSLTPQQVRRTLTTNPKANKFDVAHRLVDLGFGELSQKLPRVPLRPVLGYDPKDRYWLHAFDALGVAVATDRLVGRNL